MLHLKCFLFYNYFKVSHSKASSLNDFLKTTGERKLIKDSHQYLVLSKHLLCRHVSDLPGEKSQAKFISKNMKNGLFSIFHGSPKNLLTGERALAKAESPEAL